MNRALLAAFATLLLATGIRAADTKQPVNFSREVLPLLSEYCFHCHGPDEKTRKAKLRLDTQEGAFRKNDPVIVAGKSAESELIKRITTKDSEEVMPPPKAKKAMTPQQVELLTRWIDQGAPWGKHWSYEPLQRPKLPEISNKEWPKNPIDTFILARLDKEGLKPSPEATKTALIRRATLDLTGLPPTPQDVAAFVADNAPDAYEKVIDRLLASPAYGERMAWDWMEAARYADSNGYQGDNERTMWPWRDWAVRAFNANMPYDKFTIEQLAGDLLPNATNEDKLATGFLRNHAINGEGGRIAEENRIEYVMDMNETTATVWLGLTFTCCRCHDHKFDPLTKKDYYSMFAFFNQTPVNGGGGDPQTKPVIAISSPEEDAKVAQAEKQVAELDAQIKKRVDEIAPQQDEWEKKSLAAAGPTAKDTWTVLEPSSAKADKQTLTVLDDKSVLAGGPNPANDDYTITTPVPFGKITAIRLEALRHESMTKNGLARSDSGNFVLTHFEVKVLKKGETLPVTQTIASAEASFEQGDLKIKNAFDNDPKSGWAVYDGKTVDREHEAVFRFAQPIDCGTDATLTIALRHDSPHVSHNLGHFRLSVTDEKEPKLTKGQPSLQSVLKIPKEKRGKEQVKTALEAFQNSDETLKKLRADQKKASEQVEAMKKGQPKVMVMEDMPKPRKTLMLEKGLYNKTGDEVTFGTPASLPPLPADAPRNRLGMARWLVSAENPLTPRVTVNRFWQMFFGYGIVKTAEDFGVKAEFPKHPELLDWLAAEFRDGGWDVKKTVKLIVTSNTYKQSSRVDAALHERDPDNRLLARGPRYRMPSWMLRDQALAASGLLVNKIGGAPVKPYQPSGVWEEATFGNKRYTQDKGEALYRRSLYTFWRRIVGPLEFFDTQSRSGCIVKPTRTNSPLHALTTLNDPTYVEAARALAERTLKASPQTAERVKLVYDAVLARDPKPDELAVLAAGIDRSKKQFEATPAETKKFLMVGESKRDEKIDANEHAAWTVLCLTVMNMDEALNKE